MPSHENSALISATWLFTVQEGGFFKTSFGIGIVNGKSTKWVVTPNVL